MARVATGSRPPGVFARPVTINQLSSFDAEKLTSYEVGFKSTLLDNHLRVNLGAYYSDYSDRLTGINGFECLGRPAEDPPLAAAECPPGGSVTWGGYITTPAKLQGVELETTAEPFRRPAREPQRRLQRVRVGREDAGRSRASSSPGNLIQPRLNTSAGAQYRVRFAAGILTPRLDWQYQSKQTYNGTSSSRRRCRRTSSVAPACSMRGSRTTRPTASGARILPITNLSDKYYRYAQFNGSGFATTAPIAPPRQYLFSVKRSF